MSNFSMVFPFQPLSVQNVQVPAVRVGTYFPILKSSATFHLVMGPRRSSSERWISPSARSRTCRTNNSRGKTGTRDRTGARRCWKTTKKKFGSFAKVSGFVCVISFLIYMIYVYHYLETQGNWPILWQRFDPLKSKVNSPKQGHHLGSRYTVVYRYIVGI